MLQRRVDVARRVLHGTISNRVHHKASSASFSSSAALSSVQSVTEVDYVIVGGGSAGSVMANRLSAESGNTVALLESGPHDLGNWDWWKIQMPAGLTYNLADDKYNWAYKTTPQKHMNGRRIEQPRGRVLGGSSALNAMVYIRGHALDYERWVDEGADGWSYAECLPYFKRAQKHEEGGDDYRGGNGFLGVSGRKMDCELFDVFVEAGVQAGYARTTDLNGYRQEGFGPLNSTVWKGKRCSAAVAYLHDILKGPNKRDNLSLHVNQLVHKIEVEGDRATSVLSIDKKTKNETKFVARKEIIIAAGAINSPQLLMLSGIGNTDELAKHGIEPVHHLPGVGENLQDHLDTYMQWECKKPITLYDAGKPHNMVMWGAEWFLNNTGMCSSNHLETGGFIRTRAGIKHPDIQYHFLPGALEGQLEPGSCHAFQVHCGTMRATSKGTIKLQSANPWDAPLIDPNYLATQDDVEDIRNGVRLTREIIAQKAFDDFRGDAIMPSDALESDAEIDAWVRESGHSAYHPSCCCKMGAEDDPLAVVNSKGQVYGVAGLRVVDSSIMPSVVSGNLNAPTIMMAEKLADNILDNTPLPAEHADYFVHPNWETEQR
eukprot:m.210675 g.210675  ORF g.210675 m.210675 type:complete len:602 (+) comp33087_c0_seq2:97-1902(+)